MIARLALAGAVALAACGGSGALEPLAVQPRADSTAAFPGFDSAIYPGDAAMTAWRYPSSPYRWVGYYLAAPCHRDLSFSNKYAPLTSLGWGVAAVYVGQQDWTQIPSSAARSDSTRAAVVRVDSMRTDSARVDSARIDRARTDSTRVGSVLSNQAVACSASLLGAAQGATEAADAARRMAAEGFPIGSVVFLDIENVLTVTPALLDYYGAWIAGIARDGRFRPGVYASKRNAPDLYAPALAAVSAGGGTVVPPFWIASASSGFALTLSPAALGLDYAKVWQGQFTTAQTWNGVTLTIDANVASGRSPSGP